MENKMFCYQCQETAKGTGCTVRGVCGKTSDVANMQDLLIYVTKGLSEVTTRLRKEGKKIVISKSQEVPEYSCTYEIEIEDIQIDDEIKVYVIDSGEYSTMLFPSEY